MQEQLLLIAESKSGRNRSKLDYIALASRQLPTAAASGVDWAFKGIGVALCFFGIEK